MTWKQALKGSIKKWERIAFEKKTQQYEHCALCQKSVTCGGCPIYKVTGRKTCWGTPHDDYSDYGHYNDEAILFYLFLCMLYHEYYG